LIVVAALVVLAMVQLTLPQAAIANHSLQKLVTTGPNGGNGPFDATLVATSDSGLRTFFVTRESLVSADTDNRQDVYQRFGATTTLQSTAPAAGNGQFDAFFDAVSSDGLKVTFTTNERLVAADTDAQFDVYRRAGGVTTLLSTGPAGGNGAFPTFYEGSSKDGSHVYITTNEHLTSGDTDARQDVYERSGTTTSLVSAGGNADFDAFYNGASSDGTQILFSTYEKLAPTDTDAYPDIYKRAGGTTTEISLGAGSAGNGPYTAAFAGISSDGSRVFFTTRDKLVSGDTDTGCDELSNTVSCTDVYQRSGTSTTLISTGPTGGNGTFEAFFEGASADGLHAFFSTAESMVSADTDSTTDIYDRSGSTTTKVSTGSVGGNGPVAPTFDGASSDGAHAYFETGESLVPGDTDGRQDVYDRSGGTTNLVSTGPGGGNSSFFDASFDGASADGSRIFFHTDEPIVSSDTDGRQDVYERFASTATLISTGPLAGARLDMFFSRASADGTRAFFRTSDRLTGADTDSSQDAYVSSVIPYDHPKTATTMNVALVPSYRQTISSAQCTSRGGVNSAHGAPLSQPSCNPPGFLPGTQAHFGPASVGSARLTVIPGNLGTTADEADISISSTLTDLRASSARGGDYNPVASGPDVTLVTKLRISDLLNGASLQEPATVDDAEITAPVACTPTSGANGSNCGVTTTVDAVTPGMVTEGKAAVLAAFRVRLNDSGANNVRGDADDRNFAMQGIYVR
jgi:hypothetical protein